MRASQGVLSGMKVMPYNPGMFQEFEEVIIYPREEFKRNFIAIKEHLNYIFRRNLLLDLSDEWKLMGELPRIMERIHMIDIEMNNFFSAKDSQTYLDTYLDADVKVMEDEVLESLSNVSELSLELGWL